jgi:hypothetical protein
MYLANKYTKWYTQIISHAQSRILPDDVYTETHHIIPKSLGGKNTKDNLVALTAREHFICHLLLTRMNDSPALVYAAWMMANATNEYQTRYRVKSTIYAQLRERNAEVKRSSTQSDEAKRKNSESHKGIKWSDGMTGKKHSQETRDKMKAARARQVITEETKRKLSEFNKGKPGHVFTDEERARVSEGLRRSWSRRKALKDTLD